MYPVFCFILSFRFTVPVLYLEWNLKQRKRFSLFYVFHYSIISFVFVHSVSLEAEFWFSEEEWIQFSSKIFILVSTNPLWFNCSHIFLLNVFCCVFVFQPQTVDEVTIDPVQDDIEIVSEGEGTDAFAVSTVTWSPYSQCHFTIQPDLLWRPHLFEAVISVYNNSFWLLLLRPAMFNYCQYGCRHRLLTPNHLNNHFCCPPDSKEFWPYV